MRTLTFLAVLLVSLSASVASACSDDDAPKGTATAAASTSGGGGKVTLGDITIDDHGTADVKGKSSVEVEADSFYFQPSYLRGDPGQKVSVKVTNDSTALHNFSVAGSSVDKDVASKASQTVEITIPQSGVALFFCKYHTGQGMNGELLAGDAKPTAVPKPGGATSSGSSPDYNY